ncbi:hypothetical protein NL676_009690 [Syzygium grande]|nr:hypothetical protein NL676_009690 [Syzygium grande]
MALTSKLRHQDMGNEDVIVRTLASSAVGGLTTLGVPLLRVDDLGGSVAWFLEADIDARAIVMQPQHCATWGHEAHLGCRPRQHVAWGHHDVNTIVTIVSLA